MNTKYLLLGMFIAIVALGIGCSPTNAGPEVIAKNTIESQEPAENVVLEDDATYTLDAEASTLRYAG
jgi:hypothetical protein